MTTDLTLTVERTINAAPKDVFNAWLNPDMLRRFMIPGDGMTVPTAETDPQEGGRFSIVMASDETEIPHAGTYREISPHDRIVFTWESPYSVDDSTVTLTFEPSGGGTHLTLTHTRFPDTEQRDNHAAGWGRILSTLDGVISA